MSEFNPLYDGSLDDDYNNELALAILSQGENRFLFFVYKMISNFENFIHLFTNFVLSLHKSNYTLKLSVQILEMN